MQEALSPASSLLYEPLLMTQKTESGQSASTAHHLLCLCEALREEIYRALVAISQPFCPH